MCSERLHAEDGRMSAIAGVVDFHGGPVDPVLVARMIAPPQPCDLEVRGPVHRSSSALAFCGRRAGRAAFDQPLADSRSDCVIVFDGRIDNRQDVAGWLGVDNPARLSDARLVLDGYMSHGLEVIPGLSGDFAFAIWDGRARQLILVRDPLGVRQVCFAPVPQGLAFATDARQLLEIDGVDRRPNLVFFADWLASRITHPSDTIYQGIHRVPPAHVLTASASGVRRDRYWD